MLCQFQKIVCLFKLKFRWKGDCANAIVKVLAIVCIFRRKIKESKIVWGKIHTTCERNKRTIAGAYITSNKVYDLIKITGT